MKELDTKLPTMMAKVLDKTAKAGKHTKDVINAFKTQTSNVSADTLVSTVIENNGQTIETRVNKEKIK